MTTKDNDAHSAHLMCVCVYPTFRRSLFIHIQASFHIRRFCTAQYRKTTKHATPDVYKSFSAKEPYEAHSPQKSPRNSGFFYGKRPATWGTSDAWGTWGTWGTKEPYKSRLFYRKEACNLEACNLGHPMHLRHFFCGEKSPGLFSCVYK